MYDSVCLVGQVILIVEDESGPFAQQLQAALEWVGAETMLARTPAQARDRVAALILRPRRSAPTAQLVQSNFRN